MTAKLHPAASMPAGYIACFSGIVWREVLRFLHQRERFLSALVRPLVWLFIFAAGFRQVLGVSIIPPYQTYVLYEVFVTPGLVGMILLFNAMQSSLSMVYDRETGAMRTLLVSPFPRSFLLISKLVGRRGRIAAAGLRISADRLFLGDRAAARSAISPCCRRSCFPASCWARSRSSCRR